MAIVGTINVAELVDLTYRANLMFDNASTDPTEFVETVNDAVGAYLAQTGGDTLQDDVCGAVNAVVAAAGTVEVFRLSAPGAQSDDDAERLDNLLYIVNVSSITLQAAEHAVQHNDPMAVACFPDGGSVDEWMSNLAEWVPEHLPAFDADAFLESLDLDALLTVGADSEDQGSADTPETPDAA